MYFLIVNHDAIENRIFGVGGHSSRAEGDEVNLHHRFVKRYTLLISLFRKLLLKSRT